MLAKQSKKELDALVSTEGFKPIQANPSTVAVPMATESDNMATPATTTAPLPSLLSPPTSPASTITMNTLHVTSLPPAPQQTTFVQQQPQNDVEAQQIATSRALATAREILQRGGTQAEAAEGAKVVAREILREFAVQKARQQQMAMQAQTQAQVQAQVQVHPTGEIYPSTTMTSKADKPRKKKLLSSHLPHKFWRKNRKNKTNQNGTAEESRDDEMDYPQMMNPLTTMPASPTFTAPPMPMPQPQPLQPSQPQPQEEVQTEVRDDAEEPPEKEPNVVSNQDPATNNNGVQEVESEYQNQDVGSKNSTNSNDNLDSGKVEVKKPTSRPSKKKQSRLVTKSAPHREASVPIKTFNNNYASPDSNDSSETDYDTLSDYDSYTPSKREAHIYIRDNESVSVLTKEYMRDPNIMDVLSLDAVMEAVNKGIIDGAERKHNSRMNADQEDENSVDRLCDSIFNVLGCCGGSDLNTVGDGMCYVNRGRRGSGASRNGGYEEIVLVDNGQYFGNNRNGKRNEGNSVEMAVGTTSGQENVTKSVSWADNTMDNTVDKIILERPSREVSDGNGTVETGQENYLDGGNSKSSVRFAVKNGLKNVKNIMTNMQCTSLPGSKAGQVDANSIYEQHRIAMMAGNQLNINTASSNENTPNWRDKVNNENWRAGVNDRLNYQGPNSPASSTGGGLSPGGGMYGIMNAQPPHVVPQNPQAINPSVQQQWEQNHSMWNNVPSQQPMAGIPPNHVNMDPNASPMIMQGIPPYLPGSASPPPPIAMNARTPSMGQQSVYTAHTAANMLSTSLSSDSGDIGADKYAGMEVDEDEPRAMTGRYGYSSMPYGNTGPYATQHLMTRESEIGMNDRYSGAHSGIGGGNNAMQMNGYYDPRMNNVQGRQDGNMYHQPRYQNEGIGQTAYGNYGSIMPQQNIGMMYGQLPSQQGPAAGYGNHLSQQQPMPQLPLPQRTFMA